jgi:hypothetical protein
LKRLGTANNPEADAEVVDIPTSAITRVEQSLSASAHATLLNATTNNLPITLVIQRLKCPRLRQAVMEFLQRACLDWHLNNPRSGDLPVLARLNALDALVRNALVLHIPLEFLETDDHHSPFNSQGPQPLGVPETFPTDLCPTAMQKGITHHSWLDLFPFPGMRDNILRGIQRGQLDEDQLCDELCCDLLNLKAGSASSLIVWGNSWDAKGWEFSYEFFLKWGVLFTRMPGNIGDNELLAEKARGNETCVHIELNFIVLQLLETVPLKSMEQNSMAQLEDVK